MGNLGSGNWAKGKFADLLALAFWMFLAGVRLAQAWRSHSVIPLLLTLQAGMAAYLLARRRSEVGAVPFYQKAFAWGGALLPFALQTEGATGWLPTLLAFSGLALTAASLHALGKSFGIAPADRGLVRSGPYRWIRHPVYAGELLAVFAASCASLSGWNLGVWGILLLTTLLRIRWEERALGGYSGYVRQVRWRLFPGVW